jgi:hypothetical protein
MVVHTEPHKVAQAGLELPTSSEWTLRTEGAPETSLAPAPLFSSIPDQWRSAQLALPTTGSSRLLGRRDHCQTVCQLTSLTC